MADQKSSDKFGLGLVFGAIAGAVAAFFLTPTTGEENRKKAMEVYEKVKVMVEEGELDEKAKELFGEAAEEGKRLMAEVRSEMMTRLDMAKHEMDTFDKTKFTKFVDETIAMVGERLKASSTQMEKLRGVFLAKFEGEEKKTQKAKKILKPKISV
jgi:gas vesicle protein